MNNTDIKSVSVSEVQSLFGNTPHLRLLQEGGIDFKFYIIPHPDYKHGLLNVDTLLDGEEIPGIWDPETQTWDFGL